MDQQNERIGTVTIDDTDQEVTKLSEIYWKDYLDDQNYNKDINKMCELCIEEQIEKYGSQTIPCKGLLTPEVQLGTESFQLLKSSSTEENLKVYEALFNAYDFMELYCDSINKGKDKRAFMGRWYQEHLLKCSATSKTVRMGRRAGKTASLAMDMIHKCLTDTGSKGTGHRALLVSPFQNQTEEVIETIKKLCSVLDDNPIESSKSSPIHIIKFKNGSIIKGFTAGYNGDSIRGQPADSIWLDELDDMPVKAITAISGIFMDNANVLVWRSGTPKGEVNLYSSAQSDGVKEFHYPSFVNPNYSDQMDKIVRADLDDIGYIQECMALYGVSSNGIFQLPYIERAKSKPKHIDALDVLNARNSFIVIIGVDWNHDQVGTRIIVTAYDKNDPQFYIIDKERVSVEGWTQQKAIEKIVQLNRKYNCDHIFVDAGFGATQIGELRLYGEMQALTVHKGHPDLKLMDVEAVDFGSTVEVVDQTKGQKFKQGLKQFLVQNAVLILEKDLLALEPKKDADVIKQLKNYIQKTRNKGKVTYGYISKKIGDHDLDALMISLYGFKKMYSSVLGGAFEVARLRYGHQRTGLAEGQSTNDATALNSLTGICFGGKKQNIATTRKPMLSFSKRMNRSSIPIRNY
jgi:replicative DNA helicase